MKGSKGHGDSGRGPTLAGPMAATVAGSLLCAVAIAASGCDPEKAAEERGRQRAREQAAESRGYAEQMRSETEKVARSRAETGGRILATALREYAYRNGWELPAAADAEKSGGMGALLRSSGALSDDVASTLEPLPGAEGGKGFVYTFKGGKIPSDENPDGAEKIELGYKPGPGGRAVVYADGRAKWQPARP